MHFADDLVSILTDETYGWDSESCDDPDEIATVQDFGGKAKALNARLRLLLIDNVRVDPVRKGFTTQDIIYTYPVIITSNRDQDDLRDMYLEAKRVLDLYAQSPWAVTVTYQNARFLTFQDSSNEKGSVFVADSIVELAQYLVAIST